MPEDQSKIHVLRPQPKPSSWSTDSSGNGNIIPFPSSVQRLQRAEDKINDGLEQESSANYFRPIFEPFFNEDSSSTQIIDLLKADHVLPQETPNDSMALQIADEYLQERLALALNAFRENPLFGADMYQQPYPSTDRSKKTVTLSSQGEDTRKMVFSVITRPDGTFDKVLGVSFQVIHSY